MQYNFKKALESKLVQEDAAHSLPGKLLFNVLIAALDEVVMLYVMLDVQQ